MASEVMGTTSTRNEENSKETANERDTVKYLQTIINDHALTSTGSGKKTIRHLFTKYYRDKGKEELWLTNTFIKS